MERRKRITSALIGLNVGVASLNSLIALDQISDGKSYSGSAAAAAAGLGAAAFLSFTSRN